MKTREWQLQDAKNKLSEVIERAITDGPQEITRQGEKTAVVLSFQGDLVDFFQNSPLKGMAFDLRANDIPREGR